MATVEQIAKLRLLVAEPTEVTYTEESLETRIDEAASMDHAALAIWEEKAAARADLVNISEAGSSRSMAQAHANALLMIKLFQNKIAEVMAVAGSGVFVGRLTR